MKNDAKTNATLVALTGSFVVLAAVFGLGVGGRTAGVAPIALVDTNFLDTATARRPYVDMVRAGEDISDYDCYTCHDKNKPPPLHFDASGNIIVAKEHAEIVMGHGTHGRNNNCYNCHDENNLTQMQTRDGRKVTFTDGQLLCGSCHGPTYRDWEAGAHGRTSGLWNGAHEVGDRKVCMNCHNPHSPKFPGRKPAPGPHLLHPPVNGGIEAAIEHAAAQPATAENKTEATVTNGVAPATH